MLSSNLDCCLTEEPGDSRHALWIGVIYGALFCIPVNVLIALAIMRLLG